MSGLSGFSTALQSAVDFTFTDAKLVQPGAGNPVPNGSGGFTPAADLVTTVRAKVDHKRTYSPERGTYFETRIIILARGVTVEPTAGNRVMFGAGAWDETEPHHVLADVKKDGLGSHFTCLVTDA